MCIELAGSERKAVPGSRAIGLVAAAEPVDVTMILRRRAPLPDVQALGSMLPAHRKYMTRSDFELTHGADPSDVEKVAAFAQTHQLAIVKADPAAASVRVSGSAEAMMRAFGVKLLRYQSQRGSYRGRVGPVHLPRELDGVVTAVFGLDNRRQAKPHHRIRPLPVPGAARDIQQRSWFYPQELGDIYGFPSGDGAGECIGLLEFGGGFSDQDLDAYCSEIKSPRPKVVAVPVGRGANRPVLDPDADGEVMLDIEVAGALAPAATLAVYFSKFTEKGWIDALNAAVHDTVHKPSVLSISWGFAEDHDIWTAAAIRQVNETLQAAALMGITVCVASGDDGSSDDVEDGHAHVDFPASSPFVLGVGGTTLRAAATGPSESVWNGGPRDAGGGATGGGVSAVLPVPAWQSNLSPRSVNPGSRPGRGVPDVAAVADPDTGYFVRSGGQSGIAGGTSAAAPLWAALIARLNQRSAKPMGYINPLLYRVAASQDICRDVVAGSNDTGLVGGYSAAKGWDPCTGWGTPDGAKLEALLSQSTI